MTRTEYNRLLEFVSSYYDNKDILHGLEHVERILYRAQRIIQSEELVVDFSLILYGAYFHGLASENSRAIEDFIHGNKLPEGLLQIAVESLGKSPAETVEGRILSDSHVLEGGMYLRYLKPLLTGTYMHQSLDDTFSYIEKHVISKGQVYFDYSKKMLSQIDRNVSELHSYIKTEFRKRFIPDFS